MLNQIYSSITLYNFIHLSPLIILWNNQETKMPKLTTECSVNLNVKLVNDTGPVDIPGKTMDNTALIVTQLFTPIEEESKLSQNQIRMKEKLMRVHFVKSA